jgi:hypothetical protein
MSDGERKTLGDYLVVGEAEVCIGNAEGRIYSRILDAGLYEVNGLDEGIMDVNEFRDGSWVRDRIYGHVSDHLSDVFVLPSELYVAVIQSMALTLADESMSSPSEQGINLANDPDRSMF